MSYTSTEVKQRWESKNYKKITVRFRYDSDELLLQFLKDYKDHAGGTSQIFREALEEYIANNYPHYNEN